MPAFRTALKLVFRYPLYLLLYIVGFGILGIAIVAGMAGTVTSQEDLLAVEALRPEVAVIDRDRSELSEGIAAFYAERTKPVSIEDDTVALQDATALNLASYIVIIPEDYGETFIEAAHSHKEAPVLETVVNYVESDGIYMDLITNEYLSALRSAAMGAPEASDAELLRIAESTADLHANYDTISVQEDEGAGTVVSAYFSWISYPMTAGLIVLTAVIIGVFQTGELRRRNLCSPLSPSKMSAQVALGGVSLVFMTWLFLMLLSLIPISGGLELLTQNPAMFALCALAALVFAFVPFSIGFLLSQIGLKEMACNGLANILSLAFSFISGVFLGGTHLLSEGIQLIAHFIPTYWYCNAIEALNQGGMSTEALTSYAGSLGIVVLFAVAISSVALLVGRSRAQSEAAGGNPAAEAVL